MEGVPKRKERGPERKGKVQRLRKEKAPYGQEATERCVNGCFPTNEKPRVSYKKLEFFENLKRLDVQNDLYANGRVGFRKAVPAFCQLLGAGSRLLGAG